jgi:hypothetical protein
VTMAQQLQLARCCDQPQGCLTQMASRTPCMQPVLQTSIELHTNAEAGPMPDLAYAHASCSFLVFFNSTRRKTTLASRTAFRLCQVTWRQLVWILASLRPFFDLPAPNDIDIFYHQI